MLIVMLCCFVLSVPIAISIGLASMVGIGLNDNVSMLVVGQHLFTSIDKYTLAAIPFFILAGNLMEIGGLFDLTGVGVGQVEAVRVDSGLRRLTKKKNIVENVIVDV